MRPVIKAAQHIVKMFLEKPIAFLIRRDYIADGSACKEKQEIQRYGRTYYEFL